MLRADAIGCPACFQDILHWMYTGDTAALDSLKVFTTLRIAKFLLMSSDFEEQLLQLAASWWKAHRDPTFIYQLVEQARHLSAVEMLKTLERFHAESPVPAETRLKLFLQWVDVPSTELGDDVMFLQENLKSMSCLVECTEEKICELHTTFPSRLTCSFRHRNCWLDFQVQNNLWPL